MKILITGYPSLVAKNFFKLINKSNNKIYLLINENIFEKSPNLLNELKKSSNINILVGDIYKLNFGLSGKEYINLTKHVSHIYNFDQISDYKSQPEIVWRVNYDGVKELIDFSLRCKKISKFIQLSSTYISGNYKGLWYEDWIDREQNFYNFFQKTKYMSEKLLFLNKDNIPLTIVRVPSVIGDSVTGEIDKLGEFYYFILLYILFPKSFFSIISKNDYIVNIIPVNFLAEAFYKIAAMKQVSGKTFQIVTPIHYNISQLIDIINNATGNSISRQELIATVNLYNIKEYLKSPLKLVQNFTSKAIYSFNQSQNLLYSNKGYPPVLSDYMNVIINYLIKNINLLLKKVR